MTVVSQGLSLYHENGFNIAGTYYISSYLLMSSASLPRSHCFISMAYIPNLHIMNCIILSFSGNTVKLNIDLKLWCLYN